MNPSAMSRLPLCRRDACTTKNRGPLWCGRPARTLPIVLLVALGMAGGSAEAAEDVVLRTSTEPQQAWVGQRTLLSIEVLGADGWAQITDMGELEIPGAYVLRTESQGTRLSEVIGGTSYTGQRYQISVYCQRPGRMEIPAMPVTVTVKQWGVNPTGTPQEAMTPSTSLICKVPPGAEGVRGLISTNQLDADQTWSSRPDTVELGDAITRSVTLSAVDVSGMAFPPMSHPEIEGVGIYPGEPSVSDTSNRGSLQGQRVESVTYVLELPGEVALPAIVLPWWDIDDRVLRRIELPGLDFTVEGELVPEPVVEPEVAPAEQPRDRVLLAAVVAVLIALGLWLGLRIGKFYQDQRRAWLDSEEAAFKGVNTALRGADPGKISAALMHWLDRLDPGTRPARLDLFLEDHGDETTRAAAAALSQSLATGEPLTEARVMARGLKKARRHLLHRRHAVQRAENLLPELNG